MNKHLPEVFHVEQDTLDDFLAAVVFLCRTFDGSVTSWIRTPKRNREKGGVPASRHQSGFAVDVVLDAMSGPHNSAADLDALDQAIDSFRAEATRMGLRVLEEKRGQGGWHLHVQTVGPLGFVTLEE